MEEESNQIGKGLAWMGLWIGIGLANFGEHNITISHKEKVSKEVVEISDVIQEKLEIKTPK